MAAAKKMNRIRRNILKIYSCLMALYMAFQIYCNSQTIALIQRQETRRLLDQRQQPRRQQPHEAESIRNVSSKTREQQPFCTRDQVKVGSWVPQTLSKPPYVSKTKHLQCFPNEYYDQTPYSTWAWEPRDDTCKFSAWSQTRFCNLVRYGTVSIVGDSLSWEHYSSLLQLLGQRVHQTDQHRSRMEKRNHKQRACLERHNSSVLISGTKFVFRNDPYLAHLKQSIQEDFPFVLVLNRGAHYQNDTILMQGIRENILTLRAWQTKCNTLRVKCHLFWRTTTPGHSHCQNFTKPVNDLSLMEKHVQNMNLYNQTQKEWYWYRFQHQNQLVLDELASSGLQYQILDAYYLNILRPDGHRVVDSDCLHNCYPGKMDVYSQLLLHYLNMDRTTQDVDHVQKLMLEFLEDKIAAQNRNMTPATNSFQQQ